MEVIGSNFGIEIGIGIIDPTTEYGVWFASRMGIILLKSSLILNPSFEWGTIGGKV